jgi:hypothetical protein
MKIVLRVLLGAILGILAWVISFFAIVAIRRRPSNTSAPGPIFPSKAGPTLPSAADNVATSRYI